MQTDNERYHARLEKIEKALGEVLLGTQAGASVQFIREFQAVLNKIQIIKSHLKRKRG